MSNISIDVLIQHDTKMHICAERQWLASLTYHSEV